MLGRSTQRGFGGPCLGRTWDWPGPRGSLLAPLLLCITSCLGTPPCTACAPCRGLGSLLAVFLSPSDETRAVVCLDPSRPLSPNSQRRRDVRRRCPGPGDRGGAPGHRCLLLGLLAACVASATGLQGGALLLVTSALQGQDGKGCEFSVNGYNSRS